LTCNYTIKIINNGGYYARFELSYGANRIGRKPRLTTFTSNSTGIFKSTSAVIPLGAENLIVKLEIFNGLSWVIVHQDINLGTKTECTKCYKFWGNSNFLNVLPDKNSSDFLYTTRQSYLSLQEPCSVQDGITCYADLYKELCIF
jgi:hypothetical protein